MRPVWRRKGARQGVKDYRQEANVAPDSNIETYVAMQLEIDNWRWAGVPFYLRTGKPIYPAGSSGPAEANALLERAGRRWRPVNGSPDGKPRAER